ncbi:MAG TPA: Rv3235 family protein [Nocardioidaceae bacterium]|nr:Rv3235 family protein [Nocardioidaceae bacterium]
MTLATVTRLVPVGHDRLEAVPIAQVQGTLALDLGRDYGLPATPEYDERARSRIEATHEAAVKRWGAVFAQAVVDSIGGDRPVSQLLRWTDKNVYRDLERRVQLMRLARPATRERSIRPQVRSVHVFQPEPTTAELSVHVRHGERSRAIAARLEYRKDRWVCTALELA